jgi:hypothetical protein
VNTHRKSRILVCSGAVIACLAVGVLVGLVSLPASDGSRPCQPDLAHLRAPGCTLIASDTARAANPEPGWGRIDCASDRRQRRVRGGGDRHRTATGGRQGNRSYRRMRVLDGDNVSGGRCELGNNEHRFGEDGARGTFALFSSGERRLTFASFRLPRRFPLQTHGFQTVLQMKQTQPAANGGGTPVVELQALRGRWRLSQSAASGPSSGARQIWSTRARKRRWTRFAFDVTYSNDPLLGSIKVYVDRNGDGDARDAGERSPETQTYTLKTEIPGTSLDGIPAGQAIPSHLRIGLYHDPPIKCPRPLGCQVNVDNVQVVDPTE